MPSTRANPSGFNGGLPNDYSSDSDYDPDYRESSENTDDDELPRTMQRDRAEWVRTNVEDLEWLYRKLREDGRSVMGTSFLQLATINSFANWVYKNTTPYTPNFPETHD